MKKDLDKTALFSFLKAKGFKINKATSSDYFGDYFEILTSKLFQIRLIQDRSLQSMDISSALDKSNWYELSLVKALINNEEKLDTVTTISEIQNFLIDNFSHIQDLFNRVNYPKTKSKLDDLRNIRMRQMFPNG